MADHVTVAHGTEQAAEGEERLEAALLAEVVQHPLDGVEDRLGQRVVGAREHALEVPGLVDGHRVAVLVDEPDRVGVRAEADPLLEDRLAAQVLHEAHLGDAVQVRLEVPWPADPSAVEPGALALGVERPDPLAVELDVDHLADAEGDADSATAHRESASDDRQRRTLQPRGEPGDQAGHVRVLGLVDGQPAALLAVGDFTAERLDLHLDDRWVEEEPEVVVAEEVLLPQVLAGAELQEQLAAVAPSTAALKRSRLARPASSRECTRNRA